MRFTGLKYLQLLACLGLFACGSAERYDVVIVGGGASGTAAGLQAARMGARTLIVEEFDWLGGMLTSAGVSATDGNTACAAASGTSSGRSWPGITAAIRP